MAFDYEALMKRMRAQADSANALMRVQADEATKQMASLTRPTIEPPEPPKDETKP